MIYSLPTSLTVNGKEYSIRTDFRVVLDICAALNDPNLEMREKLYAALYILYEDFEDIPNEDQEEAVKQCFWFIEGGKLENPKRSPKLMDWEQDFQYIVAPINTKIGTDVRGLDYLHWWTFLSAFMEIGDCTFAQIVRIRKLKSRSKPLDKQDKEWYRENRDLVDLKPVYSEAEKDLFKQWGV